MKFVLLLLVLVAVIAWVAIAASERSRRSTRQVQAWGRVEAVTDVAWDHDDLSAVLAGAIIERTRGLRTESPLDALESALDDVLTLARRHRPDEPDLAVIVIDTVRRPGPGQLG